MPIPAVPLRRGDRGDSVAELHRTLASLGLPVEPKERRARVLGAATGARLQEFQARLAIPQTGVLDSLTLERMRGVLQESLPFVVFGTITGAEGKPLAGVTVIAVDMDLRKKNEVLGTATTDDRGDYEVRYSAAKFVRLDKGSADLVMRVLQGDNLVAESSLWFNVPDEARVDLRSSVNRGPAEYDRLVAEISPVLGEVQLAELTGEDVEFLAGETSEARERLAFLAAAHRLAPRVDGVAADAFYAWFRAGLSTEPEALSARSSPVLTGALVRACDGNVIAESRRPEIESWVAAIAALRSRALDAPAPRGAPPSLGDLVRSAGLAFESDESRLRVVAILNAQRGQPEAQLVDALDEAGLARDHAQALVRHLQVVDLTSGHLPLVRALEARELMSADAQAALSLDDWKKLLHTPLDGQVIGAPPGLGVTDEAARLDAYAGILDARASAAAPLVAIKQALQALPEATFGQHGTSREDTLRFLQLNPDFVLGVDRPSKLDALSEEERDRRLDGIARPTKTLAMIDVLSRTAALAGLQVVPSPEPLPMPTVDAAGGATLRHRNVVELWKTMLEAGITSGAGLALAPLHEVEPITRFAAQGPEFQKAVDGAKERGVQSTTLAVWRRVEHASLSLAAPVAMKRETPPVISIAAPSLSDGAVPRIAALALPAGGGVDWAALFGSEDACECGHCSSVLGPAAYFVDLFDFVKDFPLPSASAPRLSSIVTARRPDLENIPLTCANSTTSLPLIDVVNELLEDLVAPASPTVMGYTAQLPTPGFLPLAPTWGPLPAGFSFAPFLLPPEVYADIGAETVSPTLRSMFHFSPNAIELGPKATLTKLRADLWWLVDEARIFEIKGTLGNAPNWQQMSVTAQHRQTAGSAAERRALPAHWNLAAYDRLATSLHPWPLPFELAREEGRAYLNELKLTRADLIDAMSPSHPDGSVVTAEAAHEILNLGPQEARLIAGVVGSVAEVWGYDVATTPGWLAALSSAPEFLQRSGLDYVQMVTLFTTKAANREGLVGLLGPASDPLTCKLDRLTITGLTEVRLGRMMRFLRLWRRTGWSMVDVDRALTALGAVDLNDDVLRDLAIMKSLAKRLAIEVSDLFVWWGSLDTTDYADPNEPGATLPTLYDLLFGVTHARRSALAEGGADQARRAVLAACGLSAADGELLAAAQILAATDVLAPTNVLVVSALVRYGSLARALNVDVAGLLQLSRLTGRTPFGSPAATLAFVAAVERLRAGPFSVDEVESLLMPPTSFEPALTERLTALDAELNAIVGGTAATEDPRAVRLRAVLLELGWEEAKAGTLCDEVASRARHAVPLTLDAKVRWALPPSELELDATSLSFAGVMRTAKRDALLLAADDAAAVVAAPGTTPSNAEKAGARAAIKTAIGALYDAPAAKIPGATFGRLVTPISEAPLDWLPAALAVPPRLVDRLKYDPEGRTLTLVGDLVVADHDELLLPRAGIADPVQTARWEAFETALATLMSSTRAQWPDATLERWDPLDVLRAGGDVLAAALRVVRASRLREATVRAVAAWTDLPVVTVARNAATLGRLAPGALLAPTLRPTDGALATLVRWRKVALLARKLQLTGFHLEWLWSRGATAGFARLAALPALPADAALSFDDLSSWIAFARVRDSVPLWQQPLERALEKLPASADAAARLRVLADAAGWSRDAVAAFVPVADFASVTSMPMIIERLARAIRLAHAKRINLEDLVAAARQDLDAAATVRLRSLLQERLGKNDWLWTAQRIHDDLREKRRDALVAHVVNHVAPRAATPPSMVPGRFASADALFEYLLIDTQVNPCVQTSRVRQATASLQMLVERALASEESVDPSPAIPGWKWRWETWQKRYRVWEANRKLFLYPENWLDPSLRDDRTSEFKLLEADLARPELTPDAALSAYQRYLQEVDQLFHLEVVAFLPEVDGENHEVAHVFARTRSAPRTYYMRRFQRRRGPRSTLPDIWASRSGTWSPWEKVEFDIPGDHLLPVKLGGELALVWPVFQKGNAPDRRTRAEKEDGVAVRQEWKVQFHFARYRNQSWCRKSIALGAHGHDALTLPEYPVRRSEKDLHFRWRPSGDDVDLIVYAKTPSPLGASSTAASLPPARMFSDSGKLSVLVTSDDRAPVVDVPVDLSLSLSISGYLSIGELFVNGRYATLDRREVVFKKPLEVPLTLSSSTDAAGLATVDLWEGIKQGFVMLRNPLSSTAQGNEIIASMTMATHHSNELGLNKLAPFTDALWLVLGPRATGEQRISISRIDVGAKFDASVNTKMEGDSTSAAEFWLSRHLESGDDDQVLFEVGRLAFDWPSVGRGTLSPAGIWTEELPLRFPVTVASPLAPTSSWYTARFEGSPDARFVVPSREDDGVNYVVVDHDDTAELLALTYSGTTTARRGGVTLTPDRTEWATLMDVGSTKAADPSLFSDASPASPYAWEAAFHAPISIARALMRAGRFEAAQQWLRRIFDPTPAAATAGQPAVDRIRSCWKFPPFAEPILATTDAQLLAQINAWLEAPFRPHVIARLRPTAYMRATLMAYIDNLIAWGDRLFERGTPESIDEAVLVYVRAAKILGPRPARLPPRAAPTPHSATTLPRAGEVAEQLGEFWVTADELAAGALLPLGQNLVSILLFCMTPNDRLLTYWDTVADRLFKIRNCEDLEGHRRVLPLFEAPIDPGLLAAAVAAGLNIDDALDDLTGDAPGYRFSVLLQKATELCAEVKGLGGQLLAALEKKDGEHLALVRAGHDKGLHDLVLGVKQATHREAINAREALEFARTSAVRRLNDARQYVAKPEIQPVVGVTIELMPVPALGLKVQSIDPPDSTAHALLNPLEAVFSGGGEESSPLTGCLMLQEEARELKLLEDARASQQSAEDAEMIGGFLRYIPNTHTHVEPFGIGLDLEIGGRLFGEIASVVAQTFRAKAGKQNQQASRYSRAGSFLLRQADWAQRHNQAALEVMHLDKQLLGAMIREEITQKDVDVEQRQLDDADEMERLLSEKFSSEALYTWMSQEVLRLYKGVFALALDVARKAQRAFRHELGRDDRRFIGGDYWQDGRNGLLAGERLHQALKRMDAAYLEDNRRELELTKHVSLRERFPEALLDLVDTGACEVDLAERLFDGDYPGHYLRRLKSVSLSIPCVAGPYTNVSCTLALQDHRKRRDPTAGNAYAETPVDDDERFTYGSGSVQSISTSTGQNDAGIFEVNFRDERYLPFEGAGAISRWRLELPAEQNAFDLRTVSDVVLHVKYTAREAGGLLAKAAAADQAKGLGLHAGTRAFDVRREFPDAWAAARKPGADLKFMLAAKHFPFLPASNGAVRMFVSAPTGGSTSHEKLRVRGDASILLTCERGARAVTTFEDLTPADTEGVSVSIPHDALDGVDTLTVLVDYARPPS